MTKRKLVDIEFTLEWKCPFAQHSDVYHVANIDLIDDELPTDFAKQIEALKIGEVFKKTLQAEDIFDEEYSNDNVVSFESNLFDSNFKGQHSPPILFRYYPSAIAAQGLNTEPKDYKPFRLISKDGDNFTADKNHPLAKYYLTLSAKKLNVSDAPENTKRRKRRKRHIGKLISARGPGMQAPFEYGEPVFFENYPFKMNNSLPQIKPHLDEKAIKEIEALHSQLLPAHSRVLDLMSNRSSYLADSYATGMMTGLGNNEDALNGNNRLDTYIEQDINDNIKFPFEDNSFDDAICTLSIEYVTNPFAIMKEVARVVEKGGKFIITFSDNGVSNAISLWGQLHPFERMQLVLEYFRLTEIFIDINTFSKRGVPRPWDDKQSHEKRLSDPVYAVWGTVK